MKVMAGIINIIKLWAGSRCGATAIEYSLIATGIAMAIALVVYSLGTNVSDLFTTVKDSF